MFRCKRGRTNVEKRTRLVEFRPSVRTTKRESIIISFPSENATPVRRDTLRDIDSQITIHSEKDVRRVTVSISRGPYRSRKIKRKRDPVGCVVHVQLRRTVACGTAKKRRRRIKRRPSGPIGWISRSVADV